MEDSVNNYLSVLSESNYIDGDMTDTELQSFQNQLWLLLARRTELYTAGESSSIPTEIAEELLKSICYCITLAKRRNINVQESFSLGLLEVKSQISIAKKLLLKVKSNIIPVKNDFYESVSYDVALFFKRYDYLFFAHDIPNRIDYPLCHVLDEFKGIEYINSYLSFLYIENDFCNHFDQKIIVSLLESYSPDYDSSHINIYELILNQAIALTLLNDDIFTLNVCQIDSMHIINHILTLERKSALSELIEACEKLFKQLQIVEPISIEYVKKSANALLRKMEIIDTSDESRPLFYSLYNEQKKETSNISYTDSEPMNDEALRNLIEEIGNCRLLSDKITIVNRDIHSLRDLAEVLDICFWNEECVALFDSFDMPAILVLLHFVNRKQDLYPAWQSTSGWEREFLKYFNNIKTP